VLLPGSVVFVLWLCYGAVLWRRGSAVIEYLAGVPEKRRKVLGSALLFGSAFLLLGGLFGISQMGKPGADLNVLQWIAVALLGLVFVHCQSFAAAMLISLGNMRVTVVKGVTSSNQAPEDQSK
jgi:hypothetical protein